MKLEYINGVRVGLLDHEKTAFERMLDQYSDTAEKYYRVESNSTLTEAERKSRLHDVKKHLDHERWISQRLRPLKNIDTLKTHLQIIGGLLQANEPEYFSR